MLIELLKMRRSRVLPVPDRHDFQFPHHLLHSFPFYPNINAQCWFNIIMNIDFIENCQTNIELKTQYSTENNLTTILLLYRNIDIEYFKPRAKPYIKPENCKFDIEPALSMTYVIWLNKLEANISNRKSFLHWELNPGLLKSA